MENKEDRNSKDFMNKPQNFWDEKIGSLNYTQLRILKENYEEIYDDYGKRHQYANKIGISVEELDKLTIIKQIYIERFPKMLKD